MKPFRKVEHLSSYLDRLDGRHRDGIIIDFCDLDWNVEILADATTGTARMEVAQSVGAKVIEVLEFKDPTAGQSGPIALQMHNAGLFDEYKDIIIEENPATDRLVTAA